MGRLGRLGRLGGRIVQGPRRALARYGDTGAPAANDEDADEGLFVTHGNPLRLRISTGTV